MLTEGRITTSAPAAEAALSHSALAPLGQSQNMRRARRSRVASVTLDDLRELFHVPLQTAATSLQISETMVKRVARKFGIKKWPYRQVGWILAQICSVQRKLEEADKTPNLESALAILEQARDTVYATGTVPADMIQNLCTDLKTLGRSEPEHLAAAGKRRRDDQVEDMRTTRAMKRATSSSSTDSESSLSGAASDLSASDSPLSTSAPYPFPYPDELHFDGRGCQVNDDEFIFTDPELVLVKAANYIFDPLDECFGVLDDWV